MINFKNFLSSSLFLINLFCIKIVDFLNYCFVSKSSNGRVIILNTQYVQRYSLLEVIFGNFLKHRGYNLKALVCAGYDYCEMHKQNVKPPDCYQCRNKTFKLLYAAKIQSLDLENFNVIFPTEKFSSNNFNFKKIKKYIDNDTNYPLGETMYWNWLHYSNGNILPEDTIENKKKLLDIYKTTFGSFRTINHVIKKYKPEYVITCHGKLAQTRPAYYLKDFYNYSCLTWENFAMDDSFVWLKNTHARDQNIHNYWNYVSKIDLTKTEINEVDNYFMQQRYGKNQRWPILDKINLTDIKKIYKKLNLNRQKLVFSIFPQVSWDSTGLSHNLEELDFYEIIEFIVKNMQKYENIQLVIRSHPAETNLPKYLQSSKSIIDTLSQQYPNLPKNVFLIPGDSEISSHSLCSISDEVFFYSSTLGLEILNKKKKVNCIGVQGYYSQKSFTNDIVNKDDLLKFFDKYNTDFIHIKKRTGMPILNDKQHKEVKNLAYYIRFKLHSTIGIIKRGILIPTVFRYIDYKNYSKNLQSYLEGKNLPFDLNKELD